MERRVLHWYPDQPALAEFALPYDCFQSAAAEDSRVVEDEGVALAPRVAVGLGLADRPIEELVHAVDGLTGHSIDPLLARELVAEVHRSIRAGLEADRRMKDGASVRGAVSVRSEPILSNQQLLVDGGHFYA